MADHKHDKTTQDDIDLEVTDTHNDEPELEEIEEHSESKIKQLRKKLKDAEEAKQRAQEELQRTKADYLNAKRRLEEDTQRRIERVTIAHIEKLLPLYDSFHMAMADVATWEKADETWRKGVEGIFSQLKSIFDQNNVTAVDPTGEMFDPHQHEALSNIQVTDPNQQDRIISVIQLGFVRNTHEHTEVIRPARVAVGVLDA